MRARTAVALLPKLVAVTLLVVPLAFAWSTVSNSMTPRENAISSPHVSTSHPIAIEASAVELAWVRQFGSSVSDQVNSIAIDASGVYVAGPTYGALPGQTSAGGSDAFVRKYSPDGNVLWTSQFGSANGDQVKSIAVDASGVYVAGNTDGALAGQTSEGLTDAFVRKYHPNGTELWTSQFGSQAAEDVAAVAVDASGVYVAGWTNGTLRGQKSAGNWDVFVRKYDPNGNELWTSQFGSSEFDSVDSIAADASGLYVAGITYGTLPGQTSAGYGDAFVRKYDRNGNELWTSQFGSSGYDLVHSIAVDISGVYVGGEVGGALPGQTSAGLSDAFVRKYDRNGNELWTSQFGSSQSENILAVAVDASGVYVAGYTNGNLPGQTSAGNFDALVRKYDPNGNELWTSQFGSSGNDSLFLNSIAIDASGVSVAGTTDGALPGQTSAGYGDAFVRRCDPNGNVLGTDQFGSPEFEFVYSIAVDDSGVYVAGETNGTLPGQTSAGEEDAFVAKLSTVADTTPPVVAFTSPANNSVLTSATATVTGTASDDAAVQKVELSTDGATWMPAVGTTSWSGSVTLQAGPNTIYARATDTSGNVRTVHIVVTVTTPGLGPQGLDPVLLAGILIAVGITASAVAFLLWRRKKGLPPPAAPPPPPPGP